MRFTKFAAPVLVLAALSWFLLSAGRDTAPPQLEKVVFADGTQPAGAAFYAAVEKGYFRDEGIDPVLKSFGYGKPAMDALMNGEADFAFAAETPFVTHVLLGNQPRLLATIGRADRYYSVLGLKSSGVFKLSDLKGKKVGLPLGTTAEFYLETQLALIGLKSKDLQIVPMPPSEMLEALEKASVDAVVTWEQESYKLLKRLPDKAEVFDEESNNTLYWNFFTRAAPAREKAPLAEKTLRAVIRGGIFCQANAEECMRIVSEYAGMEMESVREIWPHMDWNVGIMQSMLVSCENQARWQLEKRSVPRLMPNFLEYFSTENLRRVDPARITLIA